MKKKKQKKTSEENSNQLSFEFIQKELPIDVHVSRSTNSVFHIQLNTAKRLAIQLAEG